MNNNNSIHTGSEINSIHHAPLIVDINAQRSYRKWGYVSWPKENISDNQSPSELTPLSHILGEGGHVSWPT